MGQWVAAMMGGLAVAGQLVNVMLNLKLRASLLESEKRVLGEVAEIYRRADICDAKMDAFETRTCLKVGCHSRQPALQKG